MYTHTLSLTLAGGLGGEAGDAVEGHRLGVLLLSSPWCDVCLCVSEGEEWTNE